jgi:polar amino acid transport system ATP-binding protein
MSFARKVSNRVICMHQGRVHALGPPAASSAIPQTAELEQLLSSLH